MRVDPDPRPRDGRMFGGAARVCRGNETASTHAIAFIAPAGTMTARRG
jgi:hypothetical protein